MRRQQSEQNETLFNNAVPTSEDYCVKSKYKQGERVAI
jgi:hypothetical protein